MLLDWAGTRTGGPGLNRSMQMTKPDWKPRASRGWIGGAALGALALSAGAAWLYQQRQEADVDEQTRRRLAPRS